MYINIFGVIEVETFGFMACYIRFLSYEYWLQPKTAEKKRMKKNALERGD